jgi:hypothetical protein
MLREKAQKSQKNTVRCSRSVLRFFAAMKLILSGYMFLMRTTNYLTDIEPVTKRETGMPPSLLKSLCKISRRSKQNATAFFRQNN